MAFQNQTNPKRVQYIVDGLARIEKSAQANSAGPDEIREMLGPVFDKLADIGLRDSAEEAAAGAHEAGPGLAPPGEGANAPQPPEIGPSGPLAHLSAGQRAALRLADQASLRQLIAALLGRLEAHEGRLGEIEAIE